MVIRNVVVVSLAAASLAACMGGPGMGGFGARKPPPAMMEQMQAIMDERAKLKRFDADTNAEITQVELETGLEKIFASFDANRDGVLRVSEIGKANEVMSAEDPSMPPVRDWNQSGAVEFEEFAAWNWGKFRRADTDKDGTVTTAELTAPPRMPSRPPGGMPPGGMPPGGKPPGGGPPGGGGMPGGGGVPGGQLSQPVATADSGGH